MKTAEQYAVTHKVHIAEANLAYILDVFGDTLAEREGYKMDRGMDAVNVYLVLKFHWLPRDVRSMSNEDKRLALTKELQDWTMPAVARIPGG